MYFMRLNSIVKMKSLFNRWHELRGAIGLTVFLVMMKPFIGLGKVNLADNRLTLSGIGTSDVKGFKFAVVGNMIREKLVVKFSSTCPNFDFQPSYQLPTLFYVERYVKKHGH